MYTLYASITSRSAVNLTAFSCAVTSLFAASTVTRNLLPTACSVKSRVDFSESIATKYVSEVPDNGVTVLSGSTSVVLGSSPNKETVILVRTSVMLATKAPVPSYPPANNLKWNGLSSPTYNGWLLSINSICLLAVS